MPSSSYKTFNDWLTSLEGWNFTSTNSVSIQAQLKNRYQQMVKDQVTTILSQEKEEGLIYRELESYLAKNWTLIKGTCLCYTSIPDAETTSLLCEIAEQVCHFNNINLSADQSPITPIQVLMPELNLEYVFECSPVFYPIKKYPALTESEQARLQDLNVQLHRLRFPFDKVDAYLTLSEEEQLAENKIARELYNNSQAEVSIHLLTEKLKINKHTAQKCIEIRLYSEKTSLEEMRHRHEQQLQEVNAGKLKVLTQNYFVSSQSLYNILKTHILSRDAHSLIPLSTLLRDAHLRSYSYESEELAAQLTLLKEEISKYERRLRNLLPGSDSFKSEDLIKQINPLAEQAKKLVQRMKELQAAEYIRLCKHSPTSSALGEAQKHVIALEKGEKSSFLDHLNVLLQKLKENDAYSGLGSEDNAARAAYEAIHLFVDYYETLGYQLKSQPSVDAPLLKDTIYLRARQEREHCFLTCQVRDITDAIISMEINATEIPDFAEKWLRVKAWWDNPERKQTAHTLEELIIEELKDFKTQLITLMRANTPAFQPHELKNEIPEVLKKEIETLIVLSRDITQNINATENVETCIARRRHAIESILIADPTLPNLLSRIACSDERKTQQKREARAALARTQDALVRFIDAPGGKEGRDVLPLTKTLVDQFNIVITLATEDDLIALLEFDANDFTTVASQPDVIQQITALFQGDLDLFVGFLHEISAQKIQKLLDVAGGPLLTQFTPHLKRILSSFTGEKWSLLAHALLRYRLASLHNYLNLYSAFPEQFTQLILGMPRAVLLEALKEQLNGHTLLEVVVGNLELVKLFLPLLPIDTLVESLKEKTSWGETILHRIASNLESLKVLFALLSEEERLGALKVKNGNGHTILGTLRNTESIQFLLPLLPIDERFEAIQEKDCNQDTILHSATRNPEMLKAVFTLLPERVWLDALKLKDRYGNTVIQRLVLPNNLKVILDVLSQAMFFEAMKVKNDKGETLVHWAAKHPESLKILLDLLSPEARLEAITEKNNQGLTVLDIAKEYPDSQRVILESVPKQGLEGSAERLRQWGMFASRAGNNGSSDCACVIC